VSERLRAEDEPEQLAIRLARGVVVDVWNVGELGASSAAELDDRLEPPGLELLAPERLEGRDRIYTSGRKRE